jgi:hypothetical protein
VPETSLESLAFCLGAARDPTIRHGERQVMSMAWMATGEPLLSSHPMVAPPWPARSPT